LYTEQASALSLERPYRQRVYRLYQSNDTTVVGAIYDFDDPLSLAADLAAVPGIVEHGIFPGAMVERVVVAGGDGVHELVR